MSFSVHYLAFVHAFDELWTFIYRLDDLGSFGLY